MERSRPRPVWRGFALAALLAAAAPGAWAGSQSSSFRVGLTITGSCSVDSRPVVEARSGASVGSPRAACAFEAPVVLQLSREAAPDLRPGEAADDGSGGPTVVVTLTF